MTADDGASSPATTNTRTTSSSMMRMNTTIKTKNRARMMIAMMTIRQNQKMLGSGKDSQ
jgi:hypothetical protein